MTGEHVSADTDDLDIFVDHGAQLQRSLPGLHTTLVHQRNYLIGAGFPYIVDRSEISSVENTIGLMGELDQFVDDISTALKDYGIDLGHGFYSAPAATIDRALDDSEDLRFDAIERELIANGVRPEDAIRIRLELEAEIEKDPRFELYGATIAEPEDLAAALAWRDGKPEDAELYHLQALEPKFEALLGEEANGDDFVETAAELGTLEGRTDLRNRLLAEGADPDQVDFMVEDLVNAVTFYADDKSARDLLDQAGDDDLNDVDNKFSLRDVTARTHFRRMEIADDLSEEFVTHDCLHPDSTPSALIRNRIFAMSDEDAAEFRKSYAEATGSELFEDVLPRPVGRTGWEHDFDRSYTIGDIQKGDLAFQLAAKIAPEMINPYLGSAEPNTDGISVDAMDVMVTGSTLTVNMQWANAIPAPIETSTVTAVVYIDGKPVTNYAGRPKRFPVVDGKFEYELETEGDIKIVFEERDLHGDYTFYTYHTSTTDDKAGYASDRLAELQGQPLTVDQSVAALKASIARTEALLETARSGGSTSSQIEELEEQLEAQNDLLDTYQDRFDGPIAPEPITAVLTVDENSVTVPLNLQIEPNLDETGHPGHGWIITDMTNPTNPRSFTTDSGSIDEAFEKFLSDSNLPPGQIAAYNPETGEEMTGYADGSSTWQKFSTGLGVASIGFFVVGGLVYLTTPVTGPGGVAGGSWFVAAGVAAAGSAVLNTADRVEHGQFELASRETFFDAVDIIGGATVVGGTVVRSGKWVAIATGVDNVTEGASVILVVNEYYDRIEQIKNDPSLDPAERQAALDALYIEAIGTGAIVYLGGRAGRQSSPGAGTQGIPGGGANARPDLNGAKLDELVGTHGRNRVRWAGRTEANEIPLNETEIDELLTGLDGLSPETQAIVAGQTPRQAYETVTRVARQQSRVTAAGPSFDLTYTERELIDLNAHGRASGLTQTEIDDLIFVGSRRSKPITADELKNQMDNIGPVRERGYPYRFESEAEFQDFSSDLSNGIEQIGLPSDDIRIQGSSLRTPNAQDVDVVVTVSQTEFTDIMTDRFSSRAKTSDGPIDMTNMTYEELQTLAADIQKPGNRDKYNSEARTFARAMSEGSFNSKGKILPELKPIQRELDAEYPDLNLETIGVQVGDSNFQLEPNLPIDPD